MAPQPKFPHEEAVRRRQAGETYTRIAADYGVHPTAIEQVTKRLTDPEWAEQNRKYKRLYQRRHLRTGSCKGCGKTIWTRPNQTGLCRSCYGLAYAASVREDALRCGRCGEWKPDEDFPHRHAAKARRGRHTLCRGCQTAARRDHRERNRDAERAHERAYKARKHAEQKAAQR
jgi:hypothetical protein